MIEEKVRRFIIEELTWEGSAQELTDDYPLIDRHVIDSMGMFHLVAFIESEFSVEVPDEELVPENFGSIEDIARYVRRREDR